MVVGAESSSFELLSFWELQMSDFYDAMCIPIYRQVNILLKRV